MNKKFLRLSLQIVLVFIVLALYLSFQVYVLKVNFQIQELQQKLADINHKNESLQLQLSQVNDTQYLENYAKTKLNMHSPSQVIFIEP